MDITPLNPLFVGEVTGIDLRDPIDAARLAELTEAIDGPMSSNVPTGDGLSEESAAKLGVVLQQITTTSRQQLEAIKLSSLITSPDTPSAANS